MIALLEEELINHVVDTGVDRAEFIEREVGFLKVATLLSRGLAPTDENLAKVRHVVGKAQWGVLPVRVEYVG